MEQLIEIVKITVPPLLVFAMAYFMLKQFFDREAKQRKEEFMLNSRKDYIPLRMQAYERAILYLERIDPNNVLMRVHKAGMSAKYLHSELLKAVRDEYTHNMAQQVYISEKGWAQLKKAKEETVQIFNTAQAKVHDNATGIELSAKIFEICAQLDHIPTELGIKVMKKEFQSGLI